MAGGRNVTEKTGGGKRLPLFKSDEEAEAFLEQDLSDYLWAGNLAPFPYELRPVGKEEIGAKPPVRPELRRCGPGR